MQTHLTVSDKSLDALTYQLISTMNTIKDTRGLRIIGATNDQHNDLKQRLVGLMAGELGMAILPDTISVVSVGALDGA